MATIITSDYASILANNLQGKYIALIRQDGTEVSGGGYQRQPLPALNVSSDANNFYLKNSADITFPQAINDWATVSNLISKIKIYDANNNLLITVDLLTPKPCYQGDILIFYTNSITITIPITT